jgi:hypothetical protein
VTDDDKTAKVRKPNIQGNGTRLLKGDEYTRDLYMQDRRDSVRVSNIASWR